MFVFAACVNYEDSFVLFSTADKAIAHAESNRYDYVAMCNIDAPEANNDVVWVRGSSLNNILIERVNG